MDREAAPDLPTGPPVFVSEIVIRSILRRGNDVVYKFCLLHLPQQRQLLDQLFHCGLQQILRFVPSANDFPYLGIDQAAVLKIQPCHKRLVVLVLYRRDDQWEHGITCLSSTPALHAVLHGASADAFGLRVSVRPIDHGAEFPGVPAAVPAPGGGETPPGRGGGPCGVRVPGVCRAGVSPQRDLSAAHRLLRALPAGGLLHPDGAAQAVKAIVKTPKTACKNRAAFGVLLFLERKKHFTENIKPGGSE